MASPAIPRNEAADRYSPEIAEALRNDGTWRAATMKSAGVRAIRMPRALIMAVMTVTTAMAAMVAGSVISLSAARRSVVPGARLDGRTNTREARREGRYRHPD